jgi:polar amino acid transport system substrate-binding protein
MSTRFALACSALVAVVLAGTAACQAPEQPPPAPDPSVAALPPGPAPAAPECNPRASLRPQGPLPVPGRMPAGSTMARIAQRGYLIAAVDRDYYGFAVRTKDLQWEGFDIDVARDIAQAIFGDREKVQFLPRNDVDRIPAAKSGDADVVIATITITCARRVEAEFSTVYFEPMQKVLVNRGSGIASIDDLGGRRVCAARSSTSLEHIKEARSRPIPWPASTEWDCLPLLQLGQVDAISTDDSVLAGMAAQDSQTEIVGPGFSEEPYGVAMNPRTPDLVRFVNAVLEQRVQDGRWEASYQRWLAALLGPSPGAPKPQYRDGP